MTDTMQVVGAYVLFVLILMLTLVQLRAYKRGEV